MMSSPLEKFPQPPKHTTTGFAPTAAVARVGLIAS
ncbi:MAG: hypothetical protein ACI9QQ_001869, partial [Myxococcota bacterium]